jgi:hypothetical protein
VAIDAAFLDSATGAAVLVLVESDPWDAEGRRLEALQERINDCVTFAVDGQMTRQFPATKGRRVVISVEYLAEPGPNEHRFFDIVREQLLEHGIELRLVALS